MSRAGMQVAGAVLPPGVPNTVRQRYDTLVEMKIIEPYPAQRNLAVTLDGLAQQLSHDGTQPPRRPRKLFRGAEAATSKGLYIHGPIGGGKTMLLDMFFDSAELSAKRRMHIHELTADYHERLKANGRQGTEPQTIAQRSGHAVATPWDDLRLLCVDEMSVTDIGDAAILSRVFTDLLARGTLLVMTANVAPDQLYEGGINRVLFAPLIRLLKDKLQIVQLDPGADFRLQKTLGEPVWHVPANAAARTALDAAFLRLTGGVEPEQLDLAVRSHTLRISGQACGVARFDFRELCLAPLWTTDYRAVAQMFHTVIVDGIPARFSHRNHARRFCALIDVLHEFKVKLIASADAGPDDVYAGMAAVLQPAIGPSSSISETAPEVLEFRRTVSRLREMRSSAYAASKWRGGASTSA